jgi:hypothetical protein
MMKRTENDSAEVTRILVRFKVSSTIEILLFCVRVNKYVCLLNTPAAELRDSQERGVFRPV